MPTTRYIASATCYVPNRASTAERNPDATLKKNGKNSIGKNPPPKYFTLDKDYKKWNNFTKVWTICGRVAVFEAIHSGGNHEN